MSPRLRPLLALVCLLASRPAAASGADVFGLGPQSSAQAGAVSASATDFSAGFYNPAGLSFGSSGEVGIGLSGFGSGLEIGGRRAALSSPLALLLGARTPLPFGGVLRNRLTFGLAISTMPTSLLHLVSREPDEAFFPLYDNRTQRLLVLPALGLRLTSRLAVGIGINYFAGLAGTVAGAGGASRAIEPRADERLRGSAGVHAGVRWDPWSCLSLAFTYRQRFSVPFSTVADFLVAGERISLTVDSRGLFSPEQWVFGVALRPRGGTTIGLDATLARWSRWDGPYVRVSSTLPVAGEINGELPTPSFSDIWTVHAGAEHRVLETRHVELRLRAGAGYDPSPIPANQPGVTNLMDGAKVVLALGAGLRLRRVLPRPVTVDAHFGLHLVAERTYVKRFLGTGEARDPMNGLSDEDPNTAGDQTSNPGYPSISGGGHVWAASVLFGVEL
jgi:hypothetical protein